jgi:lysophospholipid acyltransferase (LPLAT)-like uncharacterized protein
VKPLKRLSRNPTVRRILCRLGADYIRFVHLSGRWSELRGEAAERLARDGTPFIVAFWHGRLMMMPPFWRSPRTLHILVSEHPDGQLIGLTAGHFGVHTIAGSTTRGGAGALRRLLRALGDGECVGVVPDGPRGPRMRAGEGVVALARMSGAPILPVTFATNRRRVLATWDRFVLALPFGRGILVWGEPVVVAPDADAEAREAARRRLEDGLNAITAEADGLCGRAAVAPAEVGAPS